MANHALLGKCGFYCGVCPDYRAGACAGCVGAHQPGDCYTRDCVLRKGLEACPCCGDFPCDTILTAQRVTVLDKDWLAWKRREKEKAKDP